MEACAVICRKATVALPDANFLSPWCQSPSFRAQNRHFCALLPASFFPTAPSASNKPHSAEKYSGLASNPEHLGRISTISSKPSKKEKLNHPFPNASTYNLQELCRKGMLAPEESIYKRYDSPSHSAQLDGHPFHYDRYRLNLTVGSSDKQ